MSKKNKTIIIFILIVMVVGVIGIVGYYWYNGTYFVGTDNAYVDGDSVKAVTLISAKMTELDVKEGDEISKDDVIARQAMDGIDVSYVSNSIVKAPISGLILKTSGTVGEVEPAGTPVAIMVDQSKLYITANISEKSLKKISIDQPVDVTIDQYKGVKFTGKVSSIGQATNSAFSLIPTASTGTFTKVVQNVPVKIKIDCGNYKLYPGTNAIVKIHIK